MQVRQEQIMILKVYRDELAGIAYLKVLSSQGCESIRISKTLMRSVNTYLQPHYLLNVELIKTLKNWVLSSVTSYKTLFACSTYKHFESASKIQKILSSITSDGEQNDLLFYLQKELPKVDIENFDPVKFEAFVLARSGFMPESNKNSESKELYQDISKAKGANHI
jgi:hypothetical protein